ncbi:MAG: hemerythrin domain-containing protein, partial [Bacteroidota bacterium]
MKIFEELKKDHEVQRDLLKQLVNSSNEGDQREELVKKVKKELKSHAKSEERFFYIEMIKHDKSQEDARHSISEHHEIDEKLEELLDTKTSSTA